MDKVWGKNAHTMWEKSLHREPSPVANVLGQVWGSVGSRKEVVGVEEAQFWGTEAPGSVRWERLAPTWPGLGDLGYRPHSWRKHEHNQTHLIKSPGGSQAEGPDWSREDTTGKDAFAWLRVAAAGADRR